MVARGSGNGGRGHRLFESTRVTGARGLLGEVAEFRLWRTARAAHEIRRDMAHTGLRSAAGALPDGCAVALEFARAPAPGPGMCAPGLAGGAALVPLSAPVRELRWNRLPGALVYARALLVRNRAALVLAVTTTVLFADGETRRIETTPAGIGALEAAFFRRFLTEMREELFRRVLGFL